MECLLREGVDTIFGYPGGANLPLYDTLKQYPQVRHVLVRHEQGAAHAADAYARVTGKAGVAWATSGPGATNLVTGIANAWMDSVPLVCVTGAVVSWLIGRDGFPEAGRAGVTTTLRGLGGFPGTHELCLGTPGMHGMYWNNLAISEADLLVAVGMRFDDRVTGRLKDFAPKAKIVHIDFDPAGSGQNIAPTVPIVGDVKQVLADL